MPMPKSVVKLKKQQGKVVVEYTDDFDAAGYAMFELSRRALTDVAKFLKKTFNNTFRQYFPKRTGMSFKGTSYKVWSNAKTKYPRLQIGLKSTGNMAGFWAYYQEFGSEKFPRLGLMRSTAENNVQKIVEIESKYLSYLSEEAEALKAILPQEGDIEDDGGDE